MTPPSFLGRPLLWQWALIVPFVERLRQVLSRWNFTCMTRPREAELSISDIPVNFALNEFPFFFVKPRAILEFMRHLIVIDSAVVNAEIEDNKIQSSLLQGE